MKIGFSIEVRGLKDLICQILHLYIPNTKITKWTRFKDWIDPEIKVIETKGPSVLEYKKHEVIIHKAVQPEMFCFRQSDTRPLTIVKGKDGKLGIKLIKKGQKK